MGKQINYYMGYQDFLAVAQAALDAGCVIYAHFRENGCWRLVHGSTLDVVKPEVLRYYFHLPEAGECRVERNASGSETMTRESELYLIEAGFSNVLVSPRQIIRSRVYVTSGRYGDDGEWLARPDALTKAYNAVARAVKKAAPCTEVCCEGVNPLRRGETFTRKVYISPDYRKLVQEEHYAIG